MAMSLFQSFFAATAMTLCLSLSFFPLALGTHGIASFNVPPYIPSKCFGEVDKGTYIAAASDDFFDGGNVCGQYFTVTCTGGTNQGTPLPCNGNSVTVMITDLCPACKARGVTLDLSQEAFGAIADTASGLIQMEYN